MKKNGYASNSDLFAKRGDPWITRREGIKDFGRNPETEDAEYDFDHRFHTTDSSFGRPAIAQPKPIHHDQPIDYDKEIADARRRKASIGRKMQGAINRRRENFIEVKAAPQAFRLCNGCRSAKCSRINICLGGLR